MRSTDRCAAVDAQLEIAQRRGVAGQHMHVDAKLAADHAARIADAALAVERETGRQRMDDLALRLQRLLGAGGEHALDVGGIDLVTAEIDRGGKGFALQPAGGDIDDEGIDGQPGHPLGSVDRKPYRLLGLVEIDDHAGLHAARFLVADADDLRLVGAAAQQLAFADRLQPARSCSTPCSNRRRVSVTTPVRRARTVLLGAEPAHTFFPGFDLAFTAFMRSLIAAVWATAASGVSCTTRRPANRMSTAAMSRDSRPASRSIVASSSIA